MESNQKGVQYTIRAVPPNVDEELRRRAKEEGRSLNDVAREALERGLDLQTQPHIHHDLDHLIGTWVEDPDFDEAIRDQDRIDESDWT